MPLRRGYPGRGGFDLRRHGAGYAVVEAPDDLPPFHLRGAVVDGTDEGVLEYLLYRGPRFALVRIVIAVRGELRVEYLYERTL